MFSTFLSLFFFLINNVISVKSKSLVFFDDGPLMGKTKNRKNCSNKGAEFHSPGPRPHFATEPKHAQVPNPEVQYTGLHTARQELKIWKQPRCVKIERLS